MKRDMHFKRNKNTKSWKRWTAFYRVKRSFNGDGCNIWDYNRNKKLSTSQAFKTLWNKWIFRINNFFLLFSQRTSGRDYFFRYFQNSVTNSLFGCCEAPIALLTFFNRINFRTINFTVNFDVIDSQWHSNCPFNLRKRKTQRKCLVPAEVTLKLFWKSNQLWQKQEQKLA